MQMSRLMLVLGVLFSALAGGGTAAAEPLSASSEGIRVSEQSSKCQERDAATEIRTVLDKQSAAWNNGDLDGFMGGYSRSPGLTYISSDGEIRGYDALASRYRTKYGADRKAMGQLKFGDLRVDLLGADDALVVGRWNLVRDGQPELNGIFTLILQNARDGWKIIHDHTSVLATKPVAPPR